MRGCGVSTYIFNGVLEGVLLCWRVSVSALEGAFKDVLLHWRVY